MLTKNKLSIVLVLVLAFVIRIVAINQSLWLDEATTALVSKGGFTHYFVRFAPGDFHPPLYYLFMIFWVKLFGYSELALRMPSVLAGVGTVYFVYKISNFVSNDNKVGTIAALLLSVNGLHVYYSQEARMYAFAAFFVAMSVYFLLRENWTLFALSLVCILLTHYVSIFILPAFWLWGVIAKKDKVWWKKFILSNIFLLIPFLLWMPIFWKQLIAGLGVETSSPLWWNILGKTTAKEILLVPAKFFFGRITINNDLLYGLVVGVVGIVYSLVIILRLPFRVAPFRITIKDKSLLIWLWLLVPSVLTAVFGLFVPVFNYFRLLFILPSFYILIALSLIKIKNRLRTVATGIVIGIGIISTSVYLFNPAFHREDWKGLASFVSQESVGTNAVVLFVSDSQMEAYDYYFEKNIEYVNKCNEGFISFCQRKIVPIVSPAKINYSDIDTIWLMRYVQPIFDQNDEVRTNLEKEGYHKLSEHDFNGVVVWKYIL